MTVVAPPTPRARWPGADGWAVVLVCIGLVITWVVTGVSGFATAIGLAVLGSLVYLAATREARTAGVVRVAAPDPARVLVVIPTQNNIGTIADVVRGCLEHSAHVLVVDDGSVDGTGEAAEQAGAIVLRHAINQGKGAALSTALVYAAEQRVAHIVAIDADGQHYPSELPAFFAAIAARPDAIVLGERNMSAVGRVPRGARANSNFWVRVQTGQWMGDTQSGYRAYPVGPVLALGLVPSRYQWEVEVLVRALWSGIPVVDLPIEVYYPPAGERVSSYRKVVDTARITWLNTQLVLERILWPPRWFRARPQTTWDGRSRGFSLGWQLYIVGIRRGHRRLVQALLAPPILFYTLFSGGQGAAIRLYLARRRPELGVLGRWLGQFRVYRNFAFSLVDRFHLLLRRDDQLTIDRSGASDLAAYFATEPTEGLLIVSGHLGNPDFVSTLIGGGSRDVHVVVHTIPNDPYMRLMAKERGDRALRFIEMADGGRHASFAVIGALRNGGVVTLKADRPMDGRSVRVRFLGGTLAIATGPFLLAAMSRAPTVIVGCFRTTRNGYALHAVGPRTYVFTSRAERDNDLQRWAQEFADVMAEWTDRYPLQWYNFFDVWSD